MTQLEQRETPIPPLRTLFRKEVELFNKLRKEMISFVCSLFTRGTSAFIIVLGKRETGKTDFALLIAEILFMRGIIKHFATNIKIYDSHFPITHITDLDALETWCKTVRGKKLFIFDEYGKAMRRRTPMAKLNVKLIDNLQIMRKYKLSTVAITVSEKYIDNINLGSDVLDGYFFKPYYEKKSVRQKIALYHDTLGAWDKTITGIPPTSIDFDTWDVAPFQLHGEAQKPRFKEKDLNDLWEWSHGKTCDELNLHRMQINRLSRKFVRETLESMRHTSQV